MRKEALNVWGDESVIRDYLYMTDVARAFVLAMEKQVEQPILNIGSRTSTNLNKILKYLGEITDKNPSIKHTTKRGFDVPKSILNVTRTKKELGWEPTISLKRRT